MRTWVIGGCFLLISCGEEPGEAALSVHTADTIMTTATPDTTADTAGADRSSAREDAVNEELPPPPRPVKKPSGIYQLLLTDEDGQKVLQTVSFSPGTFRLQEEYGNKEDSIVITDGTWSPSREFIWLYKDQVVRSRYTWHGDTLQYYSPRLKKAFSMQQLEPAAGNKLWQQKKKEGALLYAVGNEPFWSVEITGQDTLVVNMPEWTAPLRVKAIVDQTVSDSTVYTAADDSIRVTVYPQFCSDGMSDFLYSQRVKMVYKGQRYKGCGETFRPSY